MNHIPVLLNEVLEIVGAYCIRPDLLGVLHTPLQNKTIIDCTFGAGGYSRAFLERGANVIAFDRDPSVAVIAAQLASEFPGRFQFINEPFSKLGEILELISKSIGANNYLPLQCAKFDAIVFDLGVSSMQIDTPERGFSFRFDALLDMRMGDVGAYCIRPTSQGVLHTPLQNQTAAELIENSSVSELARILRDYGDVKKAMPIARAAKDALPQTTFALRDLIHNPKDIAPVFQALRIAVNDEMGEIERALAAVPDLLAKGGICAVVTFHSLEDRLVKNTFREWTETKGDPRLPVPLADDSGAISPRFKLLKTVTPSDAEISANPRARSAHLRAVIKL